MSEYLKPTFPTSETFRMNMPVSRLTVLSEKPYARRGFASMNDAHNEEEIVDALPSQSAIAEKTTDKPKEESENEQSRALKVQIKDIKEKDISQMSEEELKAEYKKLYKNLASVKSSSPVKQFIRSLVSVKPLEKEILKQLEAKSVKKAEVQELRERALDEGLEVGQAKDKRNEHIIADMNDEKSNALRHTWQRYFTPEELKDEKVQQAIEDAVLEGFRPSLELASFYKPNYNRKDVATRLVEKAHEVAINKKLEEDDRKEKAWEVVLQSRKETFDLEVARREARIKDTGKDEKPVPPPPTTVEELIIQENPTKYAELTGEQRDEALEADRLDKEQAIMAAHLVGKTEGIYNFSYSHIKEKHDKLRQAGFTREDTRALMVEGITGTDGATVEAPRDILAEALEAQREQEADREIQREQNRENANLEFTEEEVRQIMKGRLKKQMAGQETLVETVENAELKAAEAIRESLKERINALTDAQKVLEFIDSPINLNGNIRRVGEEIARKFVGMDADAYQQNFQNQFTDILQEARNAAASGDIDKAKSVLQGAVEKLYDREKSHFLDMERRRIEDMNDPEKRGRYLEIHNLEDVADAIIQTNPKLWGTKAYFSKHGLELRDDKGKLMEQGNFPLLKWGYDKDGKPVEVIDEVNFKRWVRERIVRYHNFDPDSPVQFGSTIGLENPNLLRNVNLGIMINNEGLYFASRDGSLKQELRDDIERTIWLVTEARNMDLVYRQGMKKDTNFADMLAQIFQKNTFGKDYQGVNNLATLFTMDADFKSGDKKIGHAMRSAFLIYYNMTDQKKLAELFPGDFQYYDEKTMVEAIKKAMGDNYRAYDTDAQINEFIQDAELDEITGKYIDGKFVSYEKDGRRKGYYKDGKIDPKLIDKFLGAMNVFNPPSKNRLQLGVGRSLVNRTASLRAGLIFNEDPQGINSDFDSANFAEMLAMFTTYWTGAAARQDTGYAAVNAFTKTEHFQKYLDKQADPSRAGGIGNPHEYTLAKKLTADPMEGILTDHKKTTIELLESMQEIFNSGHDEEKKKKDENDIVRKWTYAHDSWGQYPTQHVGNAFKEFLDRTSGKEIRLDKFAHWDKDHKAVVYDAHHMIDEVQENLIKPTRYRWATHKLPYGHEQSVLKEAKKDGTFVYETETLAERMFGTQVLQTAEQIFLSEVKDSKPFLDSHGKMLRVWDEKEGKMVLAPHVKNYLDNKEFGRVLSKAYLVGKFGAMLGGHTTKHGTEPYLPFYTRRTILQALGTIPAGIQGDEHDMMHSHTTKFYFTDLDLKLMEKLSGNTFWKSMFSEARTETRRGIMEGLKKGLAKTIQSMFK